MSFFSSYRFRKIWFTAVAIFVIAGLCTLIFRGLWILSKPYPWLAIAILSLPILFIVYQRVQDLRWVRKGFPRGFRPEPIYTSQLLEVAEWSPDEVAKYFRDHPNKAEDLMGESQDKRFTPASYLTHRGGGFEVGWLPRHERGTKAVREFATLADAATDYLLFSRGKGRWSPQQSERETRNIAE